jgi:hypothetical protein
VGSVTTGRRPESAQEKALAVDEQEVGLSSEQLVDESVPPARELVRRAVKVEGELTFPRRLSNRLDTTAWKVLPE